MQSYAGADAAGHAEFSTGASKVYVMKPSQFPPKLECV